MLNGIIRSSVGFEPIAHPFIRIVNLRRRFFHGKMKGLFVSKMVRNFHDLFLYCYEGVSIILLKLINDFKCSRFYWLHFASGIARRMTWPRQTKMNGRNGSSSTRKLKA